MPQVDLPLRARFFPLGFPLELATNSKAVMAAAEESWKHFRSQLVEEVLELHIAVQDADGSSTLPPAPVYSQQWNTWLCVADANNFVMCDPNHGRSFGSVAQSTVDSSLYFRYHFLEAAAMWMISARTAPVHAACVSIFNSGMLLCGDSGAGKSSLAYAAARAGWTYLTDDASYLLLNGTNHQVVGNSHSIRFRNSGVELFPELEGRRITPRAAGKPAIEVPTTELHNLVTTDSAIVEYIIFLNRRSMNSDSLVPLSKESVLPWFMQFITGANESRVSQEAALKALLSVPIYELRYSTLDWAVQRLDKLATSGR
ncbi:aldolase [Alloacidobacterium dinghuense]|uniref:Aldolase n=1 Tax=Alloacidobacterium dinghuense TaxID=2763107 RepID=A0A7G8BDX5_9BACT|nr:aldolase [Alloacidobacterium dinghuense]QNI30745.1 aldolase [Alloacidobacterium dinghuense]